MARSLKKGPFVEPSLQRKIDKKEKTLKTARGSFDLLCQIVGRYENEKTL